MDQVATYAGIPHVRQPRVSPDGGRVAYLSDASGHYELSVTDGTDETRLTDGEPSPTPFAPILWGPDGDRIYLAVGDDETDTHPGVAALDGRVRRVVEASGRVFLWDVSPDGRFLWFFDRPEGDTALVRYDTETDARTEVPLEEFVHRGGGVAPSGDRIAFTDNPRAEPHGAVYVAAADGSDRRRLAVSDDPTFVWAWGPDGERLLVSDDFDGGRLGIHDVRSETTEWLDGPTGRITGVTFLPDGERVFVVRAGSAGVHDRSTGTFRTLPVDGSVRLPPVVRDGAVFGEDAVLLARSSETNPGELLRYDLRTDEAASLVDTLPATLDRSALVRGTEQTYPAADGDASRALVYEPPTTPAPGVAVVYGATPDVSRRFDRLTQLLVAEGYVVCHPAPTGDPFDDRQHAGFAAAGRWLADQSAVDGRVAAYGHSHGGYDAYVQAVRYPDVWDAAVGYNGWTDLPAVAESGGGGWVLRDNLPDYETHPGAWRAASPITDADSLGVPLLMLHGRDDPIVPVSQARRFRDALDAAGVDRYDYHELPGGHGGGTDVEQTVAAYERLVGFLDRQF